MRVLIIESDAAFASTLRQALEARGVEVATTPDGKKGIELAQARPTAAVVLSVELGDRLTGGFSWCNKFKRDAALREIPLLLTSSLATNETFEQHRKLKTRADDYLLKPFGPRELLERLEPYLPKPPAPSDDDSTFDLAGELLAGLADDEEPVVVPGAEGTAAFEEVDIVDADDLIDEIFDEFHDEPIAEAGANATRGLPVLDGEEGLEASAPSFALDAEISSDASVDHDFRASASLDAEAAALSDSIADVGIGPRASLAAEPEGGRSPRTIDTPWHDEEAQNSGRLGGRIAELELRLSTLTHDLEEQRSEAETGRAELARTSTELARSEQLHRTLQAQVDEALEQDRAFEATLAAFKADAALVPGLQDRVAQLTDENARLGSELAGALGEASALQDRVAELEAELAAAAGAELSEQQAAGAELEVLRRKNVSLETEVERHEGRVLAAYRKLEAEERAREKIRHALAHAIELLDAGLPDKE